MSRREKDGYRDKHAALEAQAGPLLAQQIYPAAFGPGRRADFTRSAADMHYGIDAMWFCDDCTARIFLQEKARGIQYSHRRDVLLRQETPTGLPSDLHKLAADYLVHCYVGPDGLGEVIILNVAVIKRRLALGTLPHTILNSSQTGPNYVLHIPDLLQAGMAAHHYHPKDSNAIAA